MYPIGKECEIERDASENIVIYIYVAYKEKTLFYKAIVIIDLLYMKGSNYSCM